MALELDPEEEMMQLEDDPLDERDGEPDEPADEGGDDDQPEVAVAHAGARQDAQPRP
jgi:hypothetical protein